MDRREKMRAARDRAEKLRTIEQWGMDVLLVSMDGNGRCLLQGMVAEGRSEQASIASIAFTRLPELLIPCMLDPETRKPILDVGSKEDAALLMSKDSDILASLLLDVFALSGLSAEAELDEGKE